MSNETTLKTVKFVLGGTVVATVQTPVGECPALPDIVSPKEGYHLMWLGSDKAVEDDTECVGYYTKGNPTELLRALSNRVMGYATDSKENASGIIPASISLLYLTMEVRRNPDSEIFRVRAVEHLKNMVNPEKDAAPAFDLSCNWPYCPLTAAIAVCHETPEIWNALDEVEQEKFDFIMECFAYVQALGTNDPNNYRTGPGLFGNFGKGWNPNYRLANIPPMIFVARYFGGAEAVDKLLLGFDYDKTVARFDAYAFNRAKKRWTRPVAVIDDVPTRTQKDFMENGGEAFINHTDARLHYTPGCTGGDGVGVRAKYTYQGATLDEYGKIIESLFRHNYSGGACISTYGTYEDGSPKAYIADNTKTPVEGVVGMMREMASGDGGDGVHGSDIRSSTGYCTHDFVLVVAMLMALKELNMYHLEAPENEEVYKLAWVGNTDYIYKCIHGYMSYSLGKPHGISYESADVGYLITKSWWLENYPDAPKCLDL